MVRACRPVSHKGTNFKFCTHSHGIDRNKSPLKMSGKLDGHSYPWILNTFHTTHIGYRAHRAVIFAIAWHLVIIVTRFTARCTLVQSAVLRSHVVCPSVCLSVTFVDQDHIGRKSWKLIARTLTPTPSLFGAQRSST